ncbi:2-hydroxyacyl-CoA dehydratase family protein [candidate division CSSED10-310 bacterium]|uniref:2-hydroxyacyl-CoA dehydratase family protein n=1 Tax=candidate division CSSED10-310 bacterium TaxID=2855610 RepID=A0ABV6Z1Y2_UNCC1
MSSGFPAKTKIGLTTSIPIEIIFAADCIPIDLNNVFITDQDPERYIAIAEQAGYPRNMCNWIKGIYGVCRSNPDIEVVVSVVRGDCSNAQALMETLTYEGVHVIPFAYPYDRDRLSLKREIDKFMAIFNVTVEVVRKTHQQLNEIRQKLVKLDTLTWQSSLVSGWTNHYFLVNSSDFKGNPQLFEAELDQELKILESRSLETPPPRVRLGYIGVPPIILDLYEVLENLETEVVFNEIQRQFSMPDLETDLIDQYLNFSYPYDVFGRIPDIKRAVEQRNINGLIHYTQSFCFRQIEDIIIRKEVAVPVLTLEGERPALIDERTKIRLETFIEMLKER